MYNWKTPKRNVTVFFPCSLFGFRCLILKLPRAFRWETAVFLSLPSFVTIHEGRNHLGKTVLTLISPFPSLCQWYIKDCERPFWIWSNSVKVFVGQKALHLVFFCRKRHPIFVPKIGMFYCKDVQKKIESNIFISQCILITSQCSKYLVLY